MPMAEVYTISGAADTASPAVQLQNALKALGNTNGDPQLSRLTVDGVIGPATVKAINYALATYIGGSTAFPRADLTVTKVRQFAGALAALVTQRVQKSGGMIPAPKVQSIVHRSAGGIAPVVHPADLTPAGTPQWVWYAVGGVSVLIVLSLAVSVFKKNKK